MRNVLFVIVLVGALSVAVSALGANDGAVYVEAVSRPMARPGVETATPPNPWELKTVRNDGAYTKQENTGDSPISYPNFAHIAHDPIKDVPYCLWREGIYSGPADLVESHWNDLFLFWTTPYEVIPDEAVARRGNGIMSDGAGYIHVAGTFGPNASGPFDIRYTRRDPVAGTWSASVQLSEEDAITDYYPTGEVDSEGNVWILYERVVASPQEAIWAYKSTDGGETWDTSNREEIVPSYDGGWSTVNLFRDPSNGDLWAVAGAFGNGDLFNDLCIWHYDATQETWMGPEIPVLGDMALNDSLGWQVALPQLVVDSQHNVHIIFEMNGQDDPITNPRTLTVLAAMGPYGTIHYVNNVSGDWSEPAEIFIVPDSIKAVTDSVCGVPSLGIDDYDNLYIGVSQAQEVDSLTATGVTWYMPVDAYMSCNPYDPVAEDWLGWTDRVKLSDLPIWELGPDSLVGADSVALYPQVTKHVPSTGETAGPGFFWCEWTADNSLVTHEMIDFKYVHATLCTLPTGIAVEVDEPMSVGSTVSLAQNRPNPFWASTEIAYGLRQGGHVRLEVYNVLGERVRTLVDRFQDAGRHRVIWNRRDESGAEVASGIYFYRLHGPGAAESKKMVVLN